MQAYINKILVENNIEYINIKKYTDLKIIYELFRNNIILDDYELTDICCTYYGLYYFINKDNNRFIRYMLMGIDRKEVNASYILGCYYEKENNIIEAKKYFMYGANNDCIKSIEKIAKLLYSESDYSKSTYYYKILHKLGNMDATYILGTIYDKLNDKSQAIKYYMIAYDNGHKKACNIIAQKIINAFDKSCDSNVDNYNIFEYICELIIKIDKYENLEKY